MKLWTTAFLLLAVLWGIPALAGPSPQVHVTEKTRLQDATTLDPSYQLRLGKSEAARDSIFYMGPWGSGAQFNGQFQDQGGSPAWNGWTHVDGTQANQIHWQISDYNAEGLGSSPAPGNLASWCGDLSYPPCSPQDPEGGYGNNWNEELRWTATVANPDLPTSVHFSAYINVDTENGYDYVYLRYLTPDGPVNLAALDGIHQNEILLYDFTIQPEDYRGPNEDQVVIQVTFESDVGWSDQDCLWWTEGALQIDDITVELEQTDWTQVSVTDFQDGFGDWLPTFPDNVGDFTQLWSYLENLDLCATNYSSQVAFLDDGLVVPGVGPSYCLDWCYGPGGYIVNPNGGAATPDMNLVNWVMSPAIDWAGGDNSGLSFDFDVYLHCPAQTDYSGIWVCYGYRSANTLDEFGNPTGDTLEGASWSSSYGWYGGPQYRRFEREIGDNLVPGVDVFQVRMGAHQNDYGYYAGQNGTPAPYFDNVRITGWESFGPGTGWGAYFLAQDNFPAIGEVDLANLGNNSVRFDPAVSWLDDDTQLLETWDVFYVSAGPQRLGAELVGHPRIHFKIKQNPLFDEFRTNPEFGATPTGFVEVDTARYDDGVPVPDMWYFDLPDSNFLFPGDIIHYYLEAADGGGPNNLEIQSITVPRDTTGFSDFSILTSYGPLLTMSALPSVQAMPGNPDQLVTPRLLLWNDNSQREMNEWVGALDNLGLVQGEDYDVFFTTLAGNGNGNGLGGRATPYSLIGYDAIIYGCGNKSAFTLSDGGFDAGNDVGLMDNWLRLGNKGLLLTGNNLVSDMMSQGGPPSIQFVEDWLKVNLIADNLRPLVQNQVAPGVRPLAGNGVFLDDLEWIAFGGCPDIFNFDAVEASTNEGGIQLATFLPPGGSESFSYSAATLYQDPDTGSQVVSMPYDLAYIHTIAGGDKEAAPLPARVRVLEQVLALFGIEGDVLDVSAVPPAQSFAVRSYPNPFNPAVKIEYTLPRPGHLSLKVYDLKGRLVRTLVDEVRESSGFVMWDGTNDQGASAASGVYFYEARSGGQVKVDKVVMVK